MKSESETTDGGTSLEPNVPTVTVIVPAYNEAERIGRCLEAIASQTYPAERVRTLVVDNCSNDGTRTQAASYDVRVIEEPKQGSYAARNKGIRTADGEILAFTDADGQPARDWLERAVARVRAGADVVTGPIGPKENGITGSTPEIYDRLFGFDTRTVKTANLVTRATVFDDVGLFRSELTSGGDVEWGERAKRGDFTVKYADDVVVSHPPRRTYQALIGKTIRTGYGSGQKKRLSNGPITVWSIGRFLLAEPIRCLTWLGWRSKNLLHKMREVSLSPITAIKLSAIILVLTIATTYGRVCGFVHGSGGRKIGDYGVW